MVQSLLAEQQPMHSSEPVCPGTNSHAQQRSVRGCSVAGARLCLLAAGALAAASVLSQLVVLLQMLFAACPTLPLELPMGGDAGGGSPDPAPVLPSCATGAGAGDDGPLPGSHSPRSTPAGCPPGSPTDVSSDSPRQQRSNASTPSKGTSSATHAADDKLSVGTKDLASPPRLGAGVQTAVSRRLGEASQVLNARLHIPLLALQFCTELAGALERRGSAVALAADAAALAGAAAGRATDVHRAASAAAAGLMAAAASGKCTDSRGESTDIRLQQRHRIALSHLARQSGLSSQRLDVLRHPVRW